ncbi:hypothetical protein [uncultured Chryseobacterium sp.]|uniref:hypothetical protein n=1 Tax=uncultured Chryseobacterium sp. TaxID=259322 RepID=UPI0025F334CB|nr:hypothetical protein [uncultured Chryseobacterium sp.]
MKPEDFTQLIHNRTEHFNIREFYAGNSEGSPKTEKIKNIMAIECTAGAQGSWFVSLSTRSGSCFSVYKEYGPTGIIKCKWVTFRNGGAVVGIRYIFDDNGKLQSAEDEEEGFHFTPHQVLEVCFDHKIDLLSDDTCIERYRDRHLKEFYYIIHFKGTYQDKSGTFLMILNGSNGVLERIILQHPGRPRELVYEKEKQS